MDFHPSRHLDTPSYPAARDPRDFIFGYGRRICPGRYVADNALFLTIAQALAVFNIDKPFEDGKWVEPDIKFEPGTISHPLPFRTSITPRSEKHRALIEKAEEMYPWEESDAEALEGITW
jgi:hypothetical protein